MKPNNAETCRREKYHRPGFICGLCHAAPVRDVMDKLPPRAWGINPGSDGGAPEVIEVRRGVKGFYHTRTYRGVNACAQADVLVQTLNEQAGVTPAQREAMINGSMFGFETPAADPDNYSENGGMK